MARIVHATSHEESPLRAWQVALPDAPVGGPGALGGAGLAWLPAAAPGTTAGALRDAGRWRPGEPLDLDAREVWWRCRFPAEPGPAGSRVLRLDGLATLADAWLNGEHLLRSESMFAAHALDVSARLAAGENELLVRFAPLESALLAKRPRPRWKTGLVRSQNLRYVRTSLLGRMPSWPLAAPVGPWRPVTLERRGPLAVLRADLATALEGQDGAARLALLVKPVGSAAAPRSAVLRIGEASTPLALAPAGDGAVELRGELRVKGARRWWPATHGEPALYPATVELDGRVVVDLGKVGFRTLALDRTDGAFSLRVNGVPIFCRGATWVPPDPHALSCPPERLRASLEAARDAGMNMLRIPGLLAYEEPAFHALCDELGLLVWQDLMLAALDYPGDDPAFAAAMQEEVRSLAADLQAHPSLAVVSGATDVRHHAAYRGRPATERSRGDLLEEVLRGAWETARPDVPYLPDNPTGGALPSHVDEGASHWFGVGAYLRPLDDARRSRVRFAAECLAFANVPEQDLLDAWPGGIAPVAHPAWKAGVPRDASAGWDFDDVRDHYFELLVGERPERVRAADPLRYLDLSRLVTGEVMEATLSELRTNGVCAGALVLAWADLVPGAGWGLLDARGVPKAAYWLLARALRPVALLVTDEGLNGFHLHAVNDGPAALGGRLEVALVRGEAEVAAGAVAVTVPARGRVRVRASEALGRFTDETYAHRFGPPPHDALVARLRTEDGAVRSEVVQLVGDGRRRVLAEDPGLTAAAEPAGPDAYVVRLSARRLAYGVRLEVGPGCAPEERYVHVAPGVPREVRVRAAAGAALAGEARPLAGAAARFAAARGGAAT